MEQNTRPAPDNNLEAYGDWVTVDTAALPAPTVRPLAAASADVEIAGELTDAEEEFLGGLSEGDHAAAAAPAAAGYPAHNGNGNGNGSGDAESGTGRAPAHGAGTAMHGPTAQITDAPATLGGETATTRAPLRAAEPLAHPSAPPPPAAAAAPAPPSVTPAPMPAVALPRAEAPKTATQSALRPPVEPDLPVAAKAPDSRATGHPAAAEPVFDAESVRATAESGGEAAGDDPLARVERRIAELTADIGEIAAQVTALQAAHAGTAPAQAPAPAPAPPAADTADHVEVSIEELDSGPEEDGGAPLAAETPSEAADAGSQPVPVIRLVPIAEEESEETPDTALAADAEHADTAPPAAAEPPRDAAPAPDRFRDDVRDLLGYLDQLLDDLPPERVREFAQSPLFATYKALFAELGLDD